MRALNENRNGSGETKPESATSLCDIPCNSYTPSAEAKSDILAVERHNEFQVIDVSKRADVAFRWIPFCFPKLPCNFTATRLQTFAHGEGAL